MNDIEWDFDFFVPGIPGPAGSKNAIPIWSKGKLVCRKLADGRQMPIINIVDSGGQRTKNWRHSVVVMAKRAMVRTRQPSALPCIFQFNFFMPRPKNEFRANGELKEWAQKYHTSTPDTTKLTRATEDALKGILWVDDSQVVSQRQTKEYVKPGQAAGCRIRVKFLNAEVSREPGSKDL